MKNSFRGIWTAITRSKTLTTTKCIGVPVKYDARYAGISDSRGLWRWKKIVVGPAFATFDDREKQAILLHEVGHCKMRHLEKRLRSLWMIFVRPFALVQLCIEQEYEADRFVRSLGYGADLARAFSRLRAETSLLHPPVSERIHRLLGAG